MSDFIVCPDTGIPISTILKNALTEDANNLIHFNIIKVAAAQDHSAPHECTNEKDFFNLFKQAIDITASIISLRVIETDNSGAANTDKAVRCAQDEPLWKTLSRTFYFDTNGQVAMRIMNTT